MTRIRGDNGKFVQKSNEPRPVRSIRATNSTWETLGNIARQRCITRADLIEHFTLNHVLHEDLEKENDRLKGEIAALRLQLDSEGKLSSPSHSNSQHFEDTKLIRVPVAIADRLLEIAHKLDSEDAIHLETESLRDEGESLKHQVDSQSDARQLELIGDTSKHYSLDDLIQKGKDIISDESLVRSKDKSSVRKYFGLLLEVDRDSFK